MVSTPGPQVDLHNALPTGTRLGEFEVRAVIGVGGFGIVYRAFDHALEREVAIKEYMPGALASRSSTLQVSVLSQGHAETFAAGLRSFVNEARLLARFDHPSLVKVHRFWEANGTAYMAMPFYKGKTLKALRKGQSAAPNEHVLKGLLEPLLGALETLHDEGVFHRDVSPDNILVTDDGKPVLLDFGAARQVISDQSQSLTAILKPNFAPIEQYGEAHGLRQGPWTDLYALGATLFFLITGTPPQPATARAMGSGAESLAYERRPGLSIDFLRAVDWMMAPRPEHRPQSVASLREVLDGRNSAPVVTSPAPLEATQTSWEHTVAHDPDDPSAPELSAVWNMRAPSDSDLRRRLALPPSERHRSRRGRSSKRRVAWLFSLLVLVATGAVAWSYAPWERYSWPQLVALASTVVAPSSESPASSPIAASAPAVASAAQPSAPASAAVSAMAPASAAPSSSEPAPNVAATAAAPASSAAEPAPAVIDSPKIIEAKSEPQPNARPETRSTPTLPRPKRAPKPADSTNNEATVVAAAGPAAPATMSPSEQCRGRVLLAWYRCVKRACQAAPEFGNSHECQRVRQIEADNNARQRAQQ